MQGWTGFYRISRNFSTNPDAVIDALSRWWMLLERRQLTNGLPGRKQWLCHIQLSRFVKSKWTEVKLSSHSKSRSRLGLGWIINWITNWGPYFKEGRGKEKFENFYSIVRTIVSLVWALFYLIISLGFSLNRTLENRYSLSWARVNCSGIREWIYFSRISFYIWRSLWIIHKRGISV